MQTSLVRHSGQISFWQTMLIVAFVVLIALILNAKGTRFFTQTIPESIGLRQPSSDHYRPSVSTATYYTDNSSKPQSTPQQNYWEYQPSQPPEQSSGYDNTIYQDDLYQPRIAAPLYSYDEQYPPRLARGYYTVQVFSGYNSKNAYDLRRALQAEGYSHVHVRSIKDSQGVLFKVRVGRYRDRMDVFAMRDQIRRRYPQNMSKSFVILVDREES